MQGTAHGSADARASLSYHELPYDGPIGATGFASPNDLTDLGPAIHIAGSSDGFEGTATYLLAQVVAGLSSVVGQFVHIQGITSTHAAVGTASALLDSAIGLRLTAHASGVSGGNLTVIWFLESKPHGQATVSGSLPVARGMSGRADGRATATQTVTRIRSVSGAANGRSDAYAFFAESELPYDGPMPATGFASPGDTTALGPAIHIAGDGTFTGIDVRVFIGGRSDATSGASANLGIRHPVTARADGRATVTGDYERVPTLGTGYLGSGTLGYPTDTVDVYLHGAAAGRSTASAGLTGHRPMAARVTGQATTSVVILRTRQLAVRVTAVAAVRGQFVNRRQVGGRAVGTSVVSHADLFRDAAGVLDTSRRPVRGSATASASLPVARRFIARVTGIATVRSTPPRLLRGYVGRSTGIATARASKVGLISHLYGSSAGVSRNALTLSPITLLGSSAGLAGVLPPVLDRDVGLGGGIADPVIRSAKSSNGGSIVLPTDIQPGDLILIGAGAYNSNFAIPTGYADLAYVVGQGSYYDHHHVIAKIAVASDAGATVSFAFQFAAYVGIVAVVIDGGTLPPEGTAKAGGAGPTITTGLATTNDPSKRIAFFSQMANAQAVPTFTTPHNTTPLGVASGSSGYHFYAAYGSDAPNSDVGDFSFTTTSSQHGGSSGILIAVAGAASVARSAGRGVAEGTSFDRLRGFQGNPYGRGTAFGGMSGKPDLLLPLGQPNGRSRVDAFMSVTNPEDPVPVPIGRMELVPARLSFDL